MSLLADLTVEQSWSNRERQYPRIGVARSSIDNPSSPEGVCDANSKKDASLASKQLRDKKSSKNEKSVAGSDLSQARGKKKK